MPLPLKKFSILLTMMSISACSSTHSRWLENPDETDINQFERDFAECEESATTVQTGGVTPEQAAVTKDMTIRALHPTPDGIAVAAVLGIAGNSLQLKSEKQQLVRQCLANKGYKLRWYGRGEDPVRPAEPPQTGGEKN